jgi:hypothetical protein
MNEQAKDERGHTPHACSYEKCGERYHLDNCMSAVLDVCDVCGGAESSMPSNCPGFRIDADTLDMITAGKVDFVNGRWAVLSAEDRIQRRQG